MAESVFKRCEIKYILTPSQYENFVGEIKKHMLPDRWGESVIQSLYYDTPDHALIRASLEKPVFKEKLRLRCYGLNTDDRDVYLEMKRKYDDTVYKRRIALKESDAGNILAGAPACSQIGSEIAYFVSFYKKLVPAALIICERNAFFDPQSDLRVTFDKNLRYRTSDLDLHTSLDGKPLTSPGTIIAEIKTSSSFPLRLAHVICREKIVKSSFSKYGNVYLNEYAGTERTFCPGSFLSESHETHESYETHMKGKAIDNV